MTLYAGEQVQKSFIDCLEYAGQPTNYERERRITTVDKQIVLDSADLKLVRMKKSDGTSSLYVFFKSSVKRDIWNFLVPSHNQSMLIGTVMPFYNLIERENNNIRRG